MIRRLALLACLALTVAACGGREEPSSSAGGAEKLDLLLDFYPNADHAGIYAAIGTGADFGAMVLLVELAEARDAIARVKKKPAGLLRVDAPVALGRAVIVPNLPGFLDRYPDIQLDLTFRDRRVDPIAEGLDVLVRMGALRDSTLIARRLGESRIVTCASRAYLSKHGVPERPRDLARHACLGYLREGRPDPFELVAGGGEGSAATLTSVDIKGPLHSNDCDVLVQMAIAGKGITHLFDFLVEPHLRSGALVSVLDACSSRRWPIHALYPKNRHLLPKVRVFLDFLDGLWRPKKPARAARTRAAKGR